MELKDLEKKLLENPKFREEYERHRLAREIAEMIAETRTLKRISQKELAKMVGTKQPSIARLENASSPPSLNFLKKICDALEIRLVIQLGSYDLKDNYAPAFRSTEITDEIAVLKEHPAELGLILSSNSSQLLKYLSI